MNSAHDFFTLSVWGDLSPLRACSFTSENVWGTRNFPPNSSSVGFSRVGEESCAVGSREVVFRGSRRLLAGGLWVGSGRALGWLRRGDLLGALDSRLFGFDGGYRGRLFRFLSVLGIPDRGTGVCCV